MKLSRPFAIALCVCLAWVQGLPAGVKDRRLDIYWIDVEGGAATLVVTPSGESVLIDSGNPGRRDPSRIVDVAAKIAGLRRIDNLVITHYHRDHFGGAATLSTMLPVKNVYDNGIFDGMPNNPGEGYFNFKCEKRIVIKPGDKLPLDAAKDGPGLVFRCLGTRQKFIEPAASAAPNRDVCATHKPKERDGSDNANSVVMLLEFGPFRFFDGGDLTWNQEHKLVCPANLVGPVDVYQVTHHGLSSSNNPVMLASLKPAVAVMNNGVTKGCTPETFATLKSAKLEAIYQMHKNLRPDGNVNNTASELIANLPKNCQGNYIKLSVAPDGSTYTIGIPATKHQRTFTTRKKGN